jgi:hypothetical protein
MEKYLSVLMLGEDKIEAIRRPARYDLMSKVKFAYFSFLIKRPRMVAYVTVASETNTKMLIGSYLLKMQLEKYTS